MKFSLIPVSLLLVLPVLLAGCFDIGKGGQSSADEIRLHGNVDEREADLSFIQAEKLARVLPEEGQSVKPGELLAVQETVRLSNEVLVAEAGVAVREAELSVAEALLSKVENGSRQQDKDIVKNARKAVQAKIKAAQLEYERCQSLMDTKAVSENSRDAAEAQYLFLKSLWEGLGVYLDKLEEGERLEDKAAAKARAATSKAALDQARANLAVCQQKLKDAFLYSPCQAIVRQRHLEPGEICLPGKPVLTLACTSPKWVRCYLNEQNLSRVDLGAKCQVQADGIKEVFEGELGYISPNAEFTPKYIETDVLRPTLVYEARVYVSDPGGRLKLGAPVVVTINPAGK